MTLRASRLWTPRGIAWLGAIAIGLMLALAGYDVWQGYRSSIRNTERELDAYARVIAEQAARSVQAVDVVLRYLARQYQRGKLETLGSRELRLVLEEQAVGMVQTKGLLVIDARGALRATTYLRAAHEEAFNFRQASMFRTLLANPGMGLAIDSARVSTTDGEWIIPLGRRLDSAQGEFGGIVAARGSVGYFEGFFRDVRLDAGTTVALVNHDRTLLARFPPVPAALGKPLAFSATAAAAFAAGAASLTRSPSPVDGVDRFVAQQPVPEYGLAVFVTRRADVALAPWREEAAATAMRTLTLAALAALLLWLLARQLARLQQTQRSLETSQERFALAVAGADDGIWEFDFRTRRVFNSARARELVGMPPGPETVPMEEWLETLPKYLHPEDVARRQAAMDAHLAGHTPTYEVDLRHRHDDGRYRWVRIRGLCVRDVDGKPVRMAGSISDIDAQRHAEDRLRASEERFALSVAGSNDGIVDWDVEGNGMYASERALEILGIRSGETVRSRDEWRALIKYHPDDQARMSRELEDFVEGRTELRDGEYRVLQPDGSYRWIRHRNKAVRGPDGRALRVAGSVSDIDARKRAEERFQLAVEGSNQGLWDWDLLTDLNYISPRLQEIMGLVPGEPLRPRKEWLALARVHPDDLERVRTAQLAHLHGETSHLAIEYRIGTPAGEWRWVRQRGVALRDEKGKAYRIAGSVEDITQFKNAEAERARLEGQLLQAKKLEAIGTLAGGIAHDFNNILSAILGYGEMAQKGAPQGSALRRHVDAVVGAGLRAKSLVERILAFSRSGVGARVAVGVEAVVREALGLAAASLPANVRLERRLEAPGATVLGDPTQIHQVVMNLCANAAQAMKSGGTLTVSLDVTDKARTQAATSVLAAGRYVRLRVADTGAGIPEEVRDRIFDPFFTTKGVGVGTGLGLSLVHGIVTDLGGGIDVESHAGEGTAFTVYLPWSDARAASAAIEESLPEGRGETVLLVDDEEPLVHLGEELIASLGYEPVGFTSSAAALAEFRASPERFQAVLSDETMPELTGSELAGEIRRIRPDIPIVLMSGFVSPALAARARTLGVVQVLAKPLTARDVARGLAAALPRHP